MNESLNPTLHYRLPTFNFEASQLQQEGLVWSNLHINLHMGSNYDQDPKYISKCLQCYASFDEMIKNSPCKVELS